MAIRRLTSTADLVLYDSWVKSHPHGNLWQSLEWKNYQEALGRETRVYAVTDGETIIASALVVIDRTSLGLSTWDMPRGPLWNEQKAAVTLLETVKNDAKKDRCLSLYLSPLSRLKTQDSRLKSSPRTEQPEATRILNLTLPDEDLLNQMHPKGRYNIKVAQKNGVTIEQSSDVESYAELAAQTAIRDKYKTAPKRQYEAFLEHLPGSFMLLAYPESYKLKAESSSVKPIAGLIGITWNSQGIYYYGASDHTHRALMAPYLLQWEAMHYCKKEGCTTYDLLGVAPANAGEGHPWRGITSFKEKFGGTLIPYPPEMRIPFMPLRRGLLATKRKIFG